jgi:hypothetical protein
VLERARAAVADAVEEAARTRHATVVLLLQSELADWERLISRLQKPSACQMADQDIANPGLSAGSHQGVKKRLSGGGESLSRFKKPSREGFAAATSIVLPTLTIQLSLPIR